jgi:hypothetical protein
VNWKRPKLHWLFVTCQKSVDEVPAITERIKVAHGIQAGNQFSEKITNELNTLVQTILKVKSTIDDTSLVISGDASESEINSMDSFGDMDDEPKDMVDMDDDMDSEMDMDMNDEVSKEPVLGRRVKTENIKHSGVKKLIENASPKNKKIIREMYARGGESRKKVIELSTKVK